MKVSGKNFDVDIEIELKNIGERDGSEVV